MLDKLRALRLPRAVYWITASAFILRVVVRCISGSAAFWENGYLFLFTMAQSIAAGKGFCIEDGFPTAMRVPLYPLFLAAVTLGKPAFWSIVIFQSLIGAATTLCTAVLARRMFPGRNESKIAILAASVTALYPYYVLHDTAIQETSLFTLITLLAVIVLQRTARSGSLNLGATSGLLLGLDILTRSTIAPFAALVVGWLLWRKRTGAALICMLVTGLVLFPWVLRNYMLTGAPALATEVGTELWIGNNGMLFDHYPKESSDLSKDESVASLTVKEQQDLESLYPNEARVDRWYLHKAVGYIRAHPVQTIIDGFRKNIAAFGWLPSPRHGWAIDFIHAISYGPVMLLGLWGMGRRRSLWRDDFLIYSLFAAFIGITALFWGHTSHRVYLDLYWIVFGAGALVEVAGKASRRSTDTSSNSAKCARVTTNFRLDNAFIPYDQCIRQRFRS